MEEPQLYTTNNDWKPVGVKRFGLAVLSGSFLHTVPTYRYDFGSDFIAILIVS
jgi:hypothetical protein